MARWVAMAPALRHEAIPTSRDLPLEKNNSDSVGTITR